MRYVPAMIVLIILLLFAYLTLYQFMNIDMTPARVFVNRWWVIAVIIILICIFPYSDKPKDKEGKW